ncbi:MAG: glycine zipper 2TM domain-containing protein [Candidatus Omnitrophica bacterium]|nr:glycine zipper 2TM domain-containing protein [Candidatus Omnitrophota bacterium]
MRVVIVSLILLVFGLAGCTTTQQGAGIGTLIGAGTGAIIGHQSGHTKEGALIGAAAGAAGGALIGDMMETKFCPTCGQGFTGGVRNCPNDGTPLRFKGQTAASAQTEATTTEELQHAQQAEKSQPKFCSGCGKSYPDSAKYCAECGTELKYKK